MDTLETLPSAPPETTPDQDSGSLNDHEAQFRPGAPRASDTEIAVVEDHDAETDAERDERGRFRHRAERQKATPADVQEINALTKELRAKEAELAKARPESVAGSPRVLTLKRQIKAIEAELKDATAPAKTEDAPRPAARPVIAPSNTFEEKEPVLDDFQDTTKYPDPYLAFMRATAAFDRRKETWEAKQAASSEQIKQDRQARIVSHNRRMEGFAAKTPDFATVTQPFMSQNMPVVLLEAIIGDDSGPEYVYYLAQHPDVVDELVLLTDHKPVSDVSVAAVQRRLKQHVQAAQTGSAAVARPTYIPPRPPNPVRTGPIRTGDDLPGDESSLSEHERAFSRPRR